MHYYMNMFKTAIKLNNHLITYCAALLPEQNFLPHIYLTDELTTYAISIVEELIQQHNKTYC